MKTHWKKQFDYKYLGSYCVDKEITLTISKVVKESVVSQNGEKEEVTVAHFKENEKPMVLNKTNCKIIETLYDTPYIEEWIGKRIGVYVDRVKSFGEVVEALRVKKPTQAITEAEKAEIKAKVELQTTEADLKEYWQILDDRFKTKEINNYFTTKKAKL